MTAFGRARIRTVIGLIGGIDDDLREKSDDFFIGILRLEQREIGRYLSEEDEWKIKMQKKGSISLIPYWLDKKMWAVFS